MNTDISSLSLRNLNQKLRVAPSGSMTNDAVSEGNSCLILPC